MNRIEARLFAGLLSLASLNGDASFLDIKFKPSRVHCGKCHTKIPPGRAGRLCQACRDANKEEGVNHG